MQWNDRRNEKLVQNRRETHANLGFHYYYTYYRSVPTFNMQIYDFACYELNVSAHIYYPVDRLSLRYGPLLMVFVVRIRCGRPWRIWYISPSRRCRWVRCMPMISIAHIFTMRNCVAAAGQDLHCASRNKIRNEYVNSFLSRWSRARAFIVICGYFIAITEHNWVWWWSCGVEWAKVVEDLVSDEKVSHRCGWVLDKWPYWSLSKVFSCDFWWQINPTSNGWLTEPTAFRFNETSSPGRRPLTWPHKYTKVVADLWFISSVLFNEPNDEIHTKKCQRYWRLLPAVPQSLGTNRSDVLPWTNSFVGEPIAKHTHTHQRRNGIMGIRRVRFYSSISLNRTDDDNGRHLECSQRSNFLFSRKFVLCDDCVDTFCFFFDWRWITRNATAHRFVAISIWCVLCAPNAFISNYRKLNWNMISPVVEM